MIPAYSPQARGRCERDSGRGRVGCRRNCGWPGSHAGRGQPVSCGNTILLSSTVVLRAGGGERHGFPPCGRRIWNEIFTVQTERVVDKDNTVTIGRPARWQIENVDPAYSWPVHGDDPRAPERDRDGPLGTPHAWPLRCRRQAARTKPPSAVEKAGPWKPVENQNPVPTAPTTPWKSRRRREIPTFPPRRRSCCCFKTQRQNQGG